MNELDDMLAEIDEENRRRQAERLSRAIEETRSFTEMFEEAEKRARDARLLRESLEPMVGDAAQTVFVSTDEVRIDLETGKPMVVIDYRLLKCICDRAKAYNDLQDALNRIK